MKLKIVLYHILDFSLMHVTDWLPTFVSAAGGSLDRLIEKPIDGIDQWLTLKKNKTSTRTEMLYNIDPGGEHTTSILLSICYIKTFR